jgi:hypothetical protein
LRRREKLPIDERLEGAAEGIPSVDRGIETGLAKLDGAYKSHRARRGSICKREVRDMACSIAGALDAIGDRWGMLILRDLMFRLSRYEDLRRLDWRYPRDLIRPPQAS